jgi:hypothetical protein
LGAVIELFFPALAELPATVVIPSAGIALNRARRERNGDRPQRSNPGQHERQR